MKKRLVSMFAVMLTAIILSPNAKAGELWLTMDQVRAFELSKPISSVVIGNPSIADVTVQDNEQIFLHAKAPGLTNMYFYDLEGKRIDNVIIRVQSATGNMLVLHRGTDQQTYSCAKNCEPTVQVGDSQTAFAGAMSQAAAKAASLSATSN